MSSVRMPKLNSQVPTVMLDNFFCHFFQDELPPRHLERTFRLVLDPSLEQDRILLGPGLPRAKRRLPGGRPQSHEPAQGTGQTQ